MKTTYVLLCKDMRRLLPFIIIWPLITSISIYYIHNEAYWQNARSLLLPFLFMIPWFSLIAAVSFIIHNAPPSGTTEFWMTRPISSRQLFVDKLIVVFLVCVLMPVLTLQLLNVFGLISDSGAINDHAWITAPVAGLLAAILSFMLMGTLKNHLFCAAR